MTTFLPISLRTPSDVYKETISVLKYFELHPSNSIGRKSFLQVDEGVPRTQAAFVPPDCYIILYHLMLTFYKPTPQWAPISFTAQWQVFPPPPIFCFPKYIEITNNKK